MKNPRLEASPRKSGRTMIYERKLRDRRKDRDPVIFFTGELISAKAEGDLTATQRTLDEDVKVSS